jgi:hypothetical protein
MKPKKQKIVGTFVGTPTKVLIFTNSFVFQCDHNEYSKIQCTLVCGHLLTYWGDDDGSPPPYYGVKWRKKQNPRNACGAHDDICIRGGYIHLLRDSLRQTSSFLLPSAYNNCQKLNTDLILCSTLDHMIILCLASSS